jgi:hypothetical protein
MRSIASLPSSNSLLRNIALSIAIVQILGAKVQKTSLKNDKKYRNTTLVVRECRERGIVGMQDVPYLCSRIK